MERGESLAALHSLFIDDLFLSTAGPFVVAFGGEESLRYWSVDEDYTVHGTSNPRNASLFFIIPHDDGKHPYEFHIAYMGDSQQRLKRRVSSLTPVSKKPIEVVPRYLSAPVTVFGSNYGPLQLKYHVYSESRLLLMSRISKKEGPISTQSWVQHREMFFINCARRKLRKDGYIAMTRRWRRGEENWVTACLPSRHNHNERDVFMLFRLLPASHRDQTSPEATRKLGEATASFEHQPSLDEKLEVHGRGMAPDAFRVPPSPTPPRKTKRPVASEDAERLIDRSSGSDGSRLLQPRVHFDTSGGGAQTAPNSGFQIPNLGTASIPDPTQPTTEDTTEL